jgi:hypothetical protein
VTTYSTGPNLALGKPTADGDPYATISDKAVDGDISTDISRCFSSHGVVAKEWWMVDLQSTAVVHKVVVATSTKSGKA